MSRILIVGAAVVDFVFHLKTLPDRAEKYGTESAEIVGGGCAANAAVAVARLGGQAVLGARLGDDAVAEMVLSDLAGEGVDISRVTQTPGARSSYSSIYLDARGERQIVNFRGQGLLLDTSWFAGIEDLGAVLTDTRRVDAALEALTLARSRGIPGVLDGEAPIAPELLSAASHAALSMQGLRSLCPNEPVEAAILALARAHGGWMCVTDGARGVWYCDRNGGVAHMPAFAITPVDTLGAGDIWHGAFALALSEGQPEPEAVRLANAAAAVKCLTRGGRAGAPTRARLDAFLKETTQ